MMEPYIEILLATFNGADFLREQIDSILAQTDRHWHLTISDDCSTDDTQSILLEYAANFPDLISIVHSENHFGNARDHFFWLIANCSSELMMTCDQDDVWFPEKVEITRKKLISLQQKVCSDTPILVFTDLIPTNDRLQPLAPSLMRLQRQNPKAISYKHLLIQNVVTGCTVGFNRQLALLAQQHVDVTGIIMHDWWLALVAARFGVIKYIDCCTMFYRQHKNNSVGAKNVSSFIYFFQNLFHLQELHKRISLKKRQATCLLLSYFENLSIEDKIFLETFSRKFCGFRFYWRYRNLFCSFSRFIGYIFLG